MAIDTSGQFWVGSDASDISPYLKAYASEGYALDYFRLATCPCGSQDFQLLADDEEGVAQRTCLACKSIHYICDSQKYWEDANPQQFQCTECGSDICNIGVGFSLYEDKSAVKWLYVGERCVKCKTLGCFAGWKVGYTPSLQLLEQV